MSTQIQDLTRLILALKKILPQGERPSNLDPFTCLRVHVLDYILGNERTEMKELAQFLGITPPSATSLINRLVRAGALSRVHDTTDRRKVLLQITTKGKKMLETGKEHIEQHMGKIFSVLNKKEMDEFIGLLKKIVDTHQKHI